MSTAFEDDAADAVRQARQEGYAAGKAEAQSRAQTKTVAATILRGHAASLEASAAFLGTFAPNAAGVLTDAVTKLRTKADSIDPPVAG